MILYRGPRILLKNLSKLLCTLFVKMLVLWVKQPSKRPPNEWISWHFWRPKGPPNRFPNLWKFDLLVAPNDLQINEIFDDISVTKTASKSMKLWRFSWPDQPPNLDDFSVTKKSINDQISLQTQRILTCLVGQNNILPNVLQTDGNWTFYQLTAHANSRPNGAKSVQVNFGENK